MEWLANYRSRILRGIYARPVMVLSRLDILWPLLIGNLIFVLVDIAVGLEDPYRLLIIGVLNVPGVAWIGYLCLHTVKAIRLWLAERD